MNQTMIIKTLATCVGVYLVIAFVLWDANPEQWGFLGRALYVWAAAFSSGLFTEWWA